MTEKILRGQTDGTGDRSCRGDDFMECWSLVVLVSVGSLADDQTINLTDQAKTKPWLAVKKEATH